MQGLHLTADLSACNCAPQLLTEAGQLAQLCRTHTNEVGLTVVDEKWHSFPDYHGQRGGVTGVLLLAESHVAVHTWPELKSVTLDIYVCNMTGDNSSKAERLIQLLEQAFQADAVQRHRLNRGEPIHTPTPMAQ